MCGYSFDINVQMFKLQIFKNLTDNVKISIQLHTTQHKKMKSINSMQHIEHTENHAYQSIETEPLLAYSSNEFHCTFTSGAGLGTL